MKPKQIELEFNLDTGEVSGESSNYEGQACSLDLGAIMGAIGKETRRVRKDTTKEKPATVKIGGGGNK